MLTVGRAPDAGNDTSESTVLAANLCAGSQGSPLDALIPNVGLRLL